MNSRLNSEFHEQVMTSEAVTYASITAASRDHKSQPDKLEIWRSRTVVGDPIQTPWRQERSQEQAFPDSKTSMGNENAK